MGVDYYTSAFPKTVEVLAALPLKEPCRVRPQRGRTYLAFSRTESFIIVYCDEDGSSFCSARSSYSNEHVRNYWCWVADVTGLLDVWDERA